MDSKDIELKSALDEIFGDDIIELDEDVSIKESKELTNEELFENTSTLVLNQEEFANINNLELEIENVKNDTVIPDLDRVLDTEEPDANITYENFSVPILDEKKEVIESNDIPLEENTISEVSEKKEEESDILDKETENKSNISIIKVIIITVLVVLLTLAGVYFVVEYNGNKEKVINCSYLFDDKNYKITDEYKITFNNKKITYIEGVYIYTSKTNEYDDQIKYIKEDKLPAIINSNGLKGFTYTYENTEDSIKISSYLDYTIMDAKEINSIDQDIKPISYFKIDLEENNHKLISLFEKQGYKCITSK